MNRLRFSGSARPGHVLGRHRGAADDEQVDPGVDDGLPQLLGALRGERAGHGDTRVADLAQPLGDQLGLDLLAVDLLHPGRRQRRVEGGDLGEQRGRVLVAGPQPLEVEHRQPAEPAERDRGLRRHHRVHRRRDHREVEVVGVDLPADRDLLGVARAARRHDGDVVEGIGPAAALAASDLDLGHRVTLPTAGARSSARVGRGAAGEAIRRRRYSPSASVSAPSRKRFRSGGSVGHT